MINYLPFAYIQQFCAEQLALYNFQNYLEVIILSILSYKALRWLQKDYIKPLAVYAYSYVAIMILCKIIAAHTLYTIMLIGIPVAIIMCIMIHQKNIQKYFATHNINVLHSKALPHQQWLEITVRSALLAAHHKKNIFCIITRQDNAAVFIKQPYALNIAVQPDVLDLLFSSSMIENPSIMLIDKLGTVKTINAVWSDQIAQHMITTQDHGSIEHCKHAASIISNSTDAIIWHIDPLTHMATAWYHGTIFQDISIDQLLMTCKQILHAAPSNQQQASYHHASNASQADSKHL